MTEIYISDAIHEDVMADIRKNALVHVGYGPGKVNYLDISENIDAVILRAETFTREMIEASPNLKIIARHGVGTDNVDIPAASQNGVWVTSTPGSNSNAVAEHVFALLLSLTRRVVPAANRVLAGTWAEGRGDLIGHELSGRTLGIVGFGAIGKRVAAMAKGFGMRVLASDPAATAADAATAGADLVELDTLYDGADIITLHAPLLPSTRHMISTRELALMKPGAVVINTSRGGLIDEDALVAALTNGTLAGAALDVLEAETINMKDPLSKNRVPLHEVPTLLVTPHIAGQTQEAFQEAGARSWSDVQAVLAGEPPAFPVNANDLRKVPA
ncbi:D-3-phosphoglycerate dehydrogenase [Arthrobacter globiformis NBRC 12137]|uniref:D-3-phosphoglycerate dehydrogenase n=1 Tax=Arthrobacter globiformis (strain ATCC 8010 / DSM 20124 / JCM 1332 / NBRC 12137 / NCIMB 8907 / NRRL B-2979 / 168) TaxID=1077972 RepID=H0QT91_ARTG1|nr:hydroxyacid dehydrogenase [Arthrobacter globiformis]GAB16042.1 D-3-phosphoglycerate dehydrogenase [Arthrobacter globiformis NBRC 12137]